MPNLKEITEYYVVAAEERDIPREQLLQTQEVTALDEGMLSVTYISAPNKDGKTLGLVVYIETRGVKNETKPADGRLNLNPQDFVSTSIEYGYISLDGPEVEWLLFFSENKFSSVIADIDDLLDPWFEKIAPGRDRLETIWDKYKILIDKILDAYRQENLEENAEKLFS